MLVNTSSIAKNSLFNLHFLTSEEIDQIVDNAESNSLKDIIESLRKFSEYLYNFAVKEVINEYNRQVLAFEYDIKQEFKRNNM